MTIEEFARHNHLHPEEGHDAWCDETMKEFGKKNHVISEGRLVHVFMPYAFHVLLVCDAGIRAQRRSLDLKEPSAKTLADLEYRERNDTLRYEQLYPGCLWPTRDFDVILNTGVLGPEEIESGVLCWHERFCSRLGSDIITDLVMPPS